MLHPIFGNSRGLGKFGSMQGTKSLGTWLGQGHVSADLPGNSHAEPLASTGAVPVSFLRVSEGH